MPTLPKVQELLSHNVNLSGIRSETNLRPIVDFKDNEVRARSSVLALHLMHHVLPSRRIVDVMIEMTRAAAGLRDSKEFFYVLNGLMRYSSVSSIVPEHGRLEIVISFYEGIKNLRATSRNPQFWLQYAIACLALGRLERAGRYFKTSYALVFDGYDTSKIDNHYARYLVEVALNEPDFNDGKRLIDQAAGILLQQMADEVKFYPYRVALGVFRFYNRSRSSLGPADKQSFKKMFSQIHKRALAARGALRNNKYVSECLALASNALADLDLGT
jgi:hypothetical protein